MPTETSSDCDVLLLHFVIIGAGIAGLTTATALRRAGHRVTVLEQDTELNTLQAGGCRLAPNKAVVLKRWGLQDAMRRVGMPIEHYCFCGLDSGEVTADGNWEEELTTEIGGQHWAMHYADLLSLLGTAAKDHGAHIRFNSRVTSMDVHKDGVTVHLASGEPVAADVVVAADGWISSISRSMTLGDKNRSQYRGFIVYNVLIPASKMREDPQLAAMLPKNSKDGTFFTWHGDSRGILGFPTNMDELCLLVYQTEPESEKDIMFKLDPEEFAKVMETSEPRLQKLSKLPHRVIGIPIYERPPVENWVHPDGPFIMIGEAAHPLTPGSASQVNIALGDGFFLGRLFKHLRRKTQIPSFLAAVMECRLRHITNIREQERANPTLFSLPAGVGEASALKGTVEEMSREQIMKYTIEAVQDAFSHDPEDEADDWWVQWGILEERAASITPKTGLDMEIAVHAHDESVSE